MINAGKTSDKIKTLLSEKEYIVADPTYIGAPVGETMPDMNNSKAKVILLE